MRTRIPILLKRYVMDESLSWEERYKQLEAHHEEETKYLLARLNEVTTRIVEITPDNCQHNREIDPDTGLCGDCGEYLP